MLRRVAVRRAVAAADVPARHAHPEMNPVAADLQAVFAAVGARCHFFDLGKMLAAFHFVSLLDSNNSIFKAGICQNAFRIMR